MTKHTFYRDNGVLKRKLLPEEKTSFKVYNLIMEGLSSQEIANKLNITIKTVKFHKTLLYKNHQVKSVAQLIVKHYKSLLRFETFVATSEDLPLGLTQFID